MVFTMEITEEQKQKLRELAARVKDEKDRQEFLLALTELMVYVDELHRGFAA